jgi:hypothetical protein
VDAEPAAAEQGRLLAVVDLERVWLHDAANLSSYLRLFSTRPDDGRTRRGEVRSYAGGRRRIITGPTRGGTIAVTLRDVDGVELDQLDAWTGELLMYRDQSGRLEFGTYFTMQVSEYKDQSGYDVAISFETVTHSIEV